MLSIITTLLLQLLDEVIVARRRGVYSFLLRASAAGNKTGSKTGTMLFLTPFHAPFKSRLGPVQTKRARRSTGRSWEVFFDAYCTYKTRTHSTSYTVFSGVYVAIVIKKFARNFRHATYAKKGGVIYRRLYACTYPRVVHALWRQGNAATRLLLS